MQFNLRLLFLLLLGSISVLATNVWNNIKIPARLGGSPSAHDVIDALIRENKEDPVPGRNYAFIEYWPGNVLEDICNGGSQ